MVPTSDTMRWEWPLNSGLASRVFMLRSIFTSPSPGTRVPLIRGLHSSSSQLNLSRF